MIGTFKDQYWFLSNPYPAEIRVGDIIYPTLEHYFQAGKLDSAAAARQVTAMTWQDAKKFCNQVELPPDWGQRRRWRMFEGVRLKFCQHPDLADLLAGTGSETLQEGNTWHDTDWGICLSKIPVHPPRCLGPGKGHNYLGRALMSVRDLLQDLPATRYS